MKTIIRAFLVTAILAMVPGLPASAAHKHNKKIINDAWYTMQAGSAPYGYYHEIIRHEKNRYFYHYDLMRLDAGGTYHESVGAIANEKLIPIAMNIDKRGKGSAESDNVSYRTDSYGGLFTVEVSGARQAHYSHHESKDTIFDVFLPIWLAQRWKKFKPGYEGWLDVFAEDPSTHMFGKQNVTFTVKKRDETKGCTLFVINEDRIKNIRWCMNYRGVLIDLVTGSYHVKRVANEAAAKHFMSGVEKGK